MLEKTILFEAQTAGYWIYRVPGVLCTSRGVVLATAEARRGRGGDWDENDALLRRSLDGGRTWGAPQRVAANVTYGAGPISNLVLIADHDERCVHALFCHNYARVLYMRSDDDGATFTTPVEVTPMLAAYREVYPWRVIATGPGHGLQLRSGRLIVPVWMSDGSGTEFGPGRLGHRPSAVGVIYSDDHGRTWERGDLVARHDGTRVANPSETLAVELADGRVLFNIRNEGREHRRLVSISPDGISRWSSPVLDPSLLEPVCMASLLRLSWPEGQEPGRILFANPDNLEHEMTHPQGIACDRKQLTVKMSADDCQTWPVSRVLEAGPSGYSDMARLPGGAALCVYECGALGGMYMTREIVAARFDLAWLLADDIRTFVRKI